MKNMIIIAIIFGFASVLWAGPTLESAKNLILAAQKFDQGDFQGAYALVSVVDPHDYYQSYHVQNLPPPIKNQLVSVFANSTDLTLWRSARKFVRELGHLDTSQQVQLIDALGKIKDPSDKSDSKFWEISQILSYQGGKPREDRSEADYRVRNEVANSPQTQQALFQLLINLDASQVARNWAEDVLATHAHRGQLYPTTQLALADLANLWDSQDQLISEKAQKAVNILAMGRHKGLSLLIRRSLLEAANRNVREGYHPFKSALYLEQFRLELSLIASAANLLPFRNFNHIKDFACAILLTDRR